MKPTENGGSRSPPPNAASSIMLKQAPPVFDRDSNGLPLLKRPPRRPAYPGTHSPSGPPGAGLSDNQPPPLPNREKASPSQDEPGFRNRLALLNPDMKALVESHGGNSLEIKKSVLDEVEKWEKEHKAQLIQVERKNEKKGGVVQVICGECRKKYPTIQKVAEHITSEHWRLSIWECDECRKSYRRRQELIDHKKKHKGKTTMLTDSTLPSWAKPIPGPRAIDLSKLQARSVRPRNGHYPPTGRATTSSAPSLAPSVSGQGGKSITQHNSKRSQEPYPNHEQTTHLRHRHNDQNSTGARLPPSTPLVHPLLPESSSSWYHFAYGSPPQKIPRGSIGGYSRDYSHSFVPAIAPVTESHSMASINRGNFDRHTMHATIPPQAQHPASHSPINPPKVPHFQQTQQSTQPQVSSLLYGVPVPSSNMSSLDVAYSGDPHDTRRPNTVGIGPSLSPDNHTNGRSLSSVRPPTRSAYPQASGMPPPHGPSTHVTQMTIGRHLGYYNHSSISITTPAPAVGYSRGPGDTGNFVGSTTPATIPSLVQHPASVNPPMDSHSQQTQQSMQSQWNLPGYSDPMSFGRQQRYNPLLSVVTSPSLHVMNTSSYHADIQDAGQPNTWGDDDDEATTSSAPLLAPPAAAQGGRPTTQQSSTHHEKIAQLHHERFDLNSIGAHLHSLPSVLPSTPLEPLSPRASSLYYSGYGSLPRQVPRGTIDGYSRDYYHSVPTTAPPALMASVNEGNFGNMTYTTIPSPQAQHPASRYPVPQPTVSHFQQTHQNMQPQGISLQDDVPLSYYPQQWYNPHPPFVAVPTSPPLHVPNTSSYHTHIQDAGQPKTMRMGSSQYGNPSVNYMDGYPQQGLY